ncbi:MAG: hypothetical protein JJU12_07265 [Chlamydiales bacterium]|nr:hypothetical protein [Chlamydiales bacterium]
MGKAIFIAAAGFLLALPLFAQTSYEHFHYHPYADYRHYTPHPYVRSDFHHTRFYPYRYHWSAHRWYGPYYYRHYDRYQYNYNQTHQYSYPHQHNSYERPLSNHIQNSYSSTLEEAPHPGKRSETSPLYYKKPLHAQHQNHPLQNHDLGYSRRW